MPDEPDDYEGIDINGPWGGVRIGAGGARIHGRADDWDEEDEVRAVRRRVRRQLDFYRHATFFAAVVGGLALLDWLTGGDFWVQWLAGIWGALLALQAWSLFGRSLWGRDVEERMVERELRRRRGRADVSTPPPTEREP